MDIGSHYAGQFKYNDEQQYFYGKVKEETRSDAPMTCGKGVNIMALVDSNHDKGGLTLCIHIGVILFVDYDSIVWHYKIKATI